MKSKNSKKEILDFIERNKDKSSETIKELLVKHFGIAQRTATDYLRLYRREHKEEAKKEVKKREEKHRKTSELREVGKIIMGEYGEYKVVGSKVFIGEEEFETVEQVEEYRDKEIINFQKRVNEILDVMSIAAKG